MSSLDLEYTRYLLSQDILNFSIRGLDSRKSYEMKNILERWLLDMYNRYPFDPKKNLLPQITDNYTNNKMAEEIVEKRIRPNKSESDLLVSNIWQLINTHNKIIESSNIYQTWSTHITYENINFELTPNLRYIINKWPIDIVLMMLLRYASLLPGGQHWGIPWLMADFLYELGFRNEGFASPMNSRFIDKPEGKFCSLFVDDSQFGSLGSFFSVDMVEYPGDWMINPPYVASLFDPILDKINDFFKRTEGKRRVFVLLPAWTDTNIYQELSKSPYLVSMEIMEKGSYYYQNPEREVIVPPVRSVYFILGEPLSADVLKQIRDLWRPPK